MATHFSLRSRPRDRARDHKERTDAASEELRFLNLKVETSFATQLTWKVRITMDQSTGGEIEAEWSSTCSRLSISGMTHLKAIKEGGRERERERERELGCRGSERVVHPLSLAVNISGRHQSAVAAAAASRSLPPSLPPSSAAVAPSVVPCHVCALPLSLVEHLHTFSCL